jgi:hypothetical protein
LAGFPSARDSPLIDHRGQIPLTGTGKCHHLPEIVVT